MVSIGIVGAGISGLHLALHLQRHAVPVTLYSPCSMADYAAGPIQNLVTRWGPTLERDDALGVRDATAHVSTRMRLRIPAADVDLIGRLAAPAETTDFRCYLPRLAGAFVQRGGRFEVTACGPTDLASLGERHDLLVVAAGRGFGDTFPVDVARSHSVPSRYWTGGLYAGARWSDEVDIEITVVPGVAEIFNIRLESRSGPLPNIGFAAVPGGPLEFLSRFPRTADPGGFAAAVLDALQSFAPHVLERVDRSTFGPAGPGEIIQGPITPCVRRAWTRLANGRLAMAVGDAWILNDPILAQGANLASRNAFTLGAAILAGGPYDEQFCRATEAAMWSEAEGPCALTNAFLQPPPAHVMDLFARAGHDQSLADRIVSGLAAPDDFLDLLAPAPATC